MGSVHYCRMVICIWFVLQTLHRLVPIQDSYPCIHRMWSFNRKHVFTSCRRPDPPWFGHIHWENLLATLLRQPEQAYNYTYLWYAVHMCTQHSPQPPLCMHDYQSSIPALGTFVNQLWHQVTSQTHVRSEVRVEYWHECGEIAQRILNKTGTSSRRQRT